MASISTVHNVNAILFNQTREMHVNGDSSDTPTTKREMKLKIYERTLDNNEREIRAELSCPSDDTYVYAAGVTKTSFPRLVKKHSLTVDMDNLAQKMIEKLAPAGNEIYVLLSEDRLKCSLQISPPNDYERRSLPLEFHALKGEEHLSYVKGELRAQITSNRQNHAARKKAEEKIVALEKEAKKAKELEELVEDLRGQLRETKEAAEDNKIDLNAANQKLQAAESETEELGEKMRELKEELSELQDDYIDTFKKAQKATEAEEMAKYENEELEKEINKLYSRIDNLESDLDDAKNNVRKANAEIDSLVRKLKRTEKDPAIVDKVMAMVKKGETSVLSCDERKLRELEADLKEKNELIEQMTARIAELTNAKDESDRSVKLLQEEVEKSRRLVEVYRRGSPSSSHGITSMTSPLYSPSPLAYSTPPTAFHTTTPATARLPPLSRLDVQQRPHLAVLSAPLSRPLTPVLGRNFNVLNGPAIPRSPVITSYQKGPTQPNATNRPNH